MEAIDRPFLLDGQLVHVGVSIGIAMAPLNGSQPEELLRNADFALYKVKGEGKGSFCLFEPALAERMQARIRLEADMRRALEVGEFEVHYQPLVDAETGVVTAAEALASPCTRPHSADRVHPPGRGDRPHPAPGCLGAANGLYAGVDVVQLDQGGGQSLARSVPRRPSRGNGRCDPRGDRA